MTELAVSRSWVEWVRPDPYVLPKEGTFSRWLSDVVRGTPYTLTRMPVSAALTTGGAVLGGPLGATAGAALSSLIQTNGEAQLEQAHVWRELVDRGMDPAEAYDKSFNEVYLPNFGLLYLSNFLQDRLTFGVPMGRGYFTRRATTDCFNAASRVMRKLMTMKNKSGQCGNFVIK